MRYYDCEDRKDPKGLIKLHDVLLMCPGDKDQVLFISIFSRCDLLMDANIDITNSPQYNQPYTIQLMTPDRNWVLATDSQKERVCELNSECFSLCIYLSLFIVSICSSLPLCP